MWHTAPQSNLATLLWCPHCQLKFCPRLPEASRKYYTVCTDTRTHLRAPSLPFCLPSHLLLLPPVRGQLAEVVSDVSPISPTCSALQTLRDCLRWRQRRSETIQSHASDARHNLCCCCFGCALCLRTIWNTATMSACCAKMKWTLSGLLNRFLMTISGWHGHDPLAMSDHCLGLKKSIC